MNARPNQRHDRMRNGISNNVCVLIRHTTQLSLADVKVNVICPHCMEPFGWANRYLSHKCIRAMKDPTDDFQASRIVRKVRRRWERSQLRRSGASTIENDSTHRKRKRVRPTIGEKESESGNNRKFGVSDQWPDGILEYERGVDYRQSVNAMPSVSNNPDDDGMWFRGNMFRRPHIESSAAWVSGSAGAISEALSHQQQEPYIQYVSSTLAIPGNGETMSENTSHDWEHPTRLPTGTVPSHENAARISEPPFGRWADSGQYLGSGAAMPGNGDMAGEVPSLGLCETIPRQQCHRERERGSWLYGQHQG
ncbi:uncharacterized protein F5Z01DRAFT_659874 [Emericellopsis atlantica]|uniref:Uncharacterized protein n=1 Tax=Emericellopsis atlantica TaxID=2614577 RepID=A0A9P8CPB0_9HYPO|nr:uncharacterized protein F5Z01DRAFT_659874 [Emericellopsis atlantica]KAG9252586.1 hypothetical protein F5Z01DRAFT_659874 [Emericellopsis atlantica]